MFGLGQSILEDGSAIIVVRCRIELKRVRVLEELDQHFGNIAIAEAPVQKRSDVAHEPFLLRLNVLHVRQVVHPWQMSGHPMNKIVTEDL